MPAPVSPPLITALSTPPQTTDITNFDARADTHVLETQALVPELNTANLNVYNNALSAYNSATASAASSVTASSFADNSAASAAAAALSTGVAVWVSGSSYAQYVVVISPTDFQNYRRISAGAGVTDPSLDPANWRIINYDKNWVVKTANYTAVNGERIMANTTAGAFIITLPASPGLGWKVSISDYKNMFGTNKLTIARNGSLIEGLAEDMDITSRGYARNLEYVDSTIGWKQV